MNQGLLKGFFNQETRHGILAGLCLAYSVLLIVLAPVRPLWLDEIIQLIGTSNLTPGDLLSYIANDPGQAPIHYFAQAGTLKLFGQSIYAVRAISMLASLLSCIAFYRLAALIGTTSKVLAGVSFALLPIQLRYALEGRPYALALLLAIVSTIALLKLEQKLSIGFTGLYLLFVCSGVLTQPYFVFVPIAHLSYVMLTSVRRPAFVRRLWFCLAIMILSYGPWYLRCRSTLNAMDVHAHMQINTPLVVFKELVGGGYLASVVIFGCAVFVLVNQSVSRDRKVLLSSLAVVPVIGPLTADYFFGYFFASRQTIYAVPGLVLFVLTAVQAAAPIARRVVYAWFLTVLVVSDVLFFGKQHENWGEAAHLIQSELQMNKNSCILFVPAGSMRYYTYFEPQLARRMCEPQLLSQMIIVAASPYGEQTTYANVETQLKEQGRNVAPVWAGLPKVLQFK